MNPTGLAGSVAAPVVAVVDEEKFNRFKKNCCHALVGRFVFPSKNSLCG
jgi:hypothetical protein